ncbi:MAG TPA: hypothetical protein VF263_21295 [Longimicrobiaceae bacterium]
MRGPRHRPEQQLQLQQLPGQFQLQQLRGLLQQQLYRKLQLRQLQQQLQHGEQLQQLYQQLQHGKQLQQQQFQLRLLQQQRIQLQQLQQRVIPWPGGGTRPRTALPFTPSTIRARLWRRATHRGVRGRRPGASPSPPHRMKARMIPDRGDPS